MFTSIAKLFTRPGGTARGDVRTRLALQALEPRDTPAVIVADWTVGMTAADYARAGVAPRAGDIVVSGERHVQLESTGTGVRVVASSQTVELPYSRTGSNPRVFVYGTGEADYIDNNTSHQLVAFGRGGNDFIWGGWGNDTLIGEGGNDTLKGYAGDDRLYGDAGHDDLRGEDGNDYLYGGSGDDWLEGNQGDDRLWGEDGSDKLFGDGWDITRNWLGLLEVGTPGPAGNDILHGGTGLDYFYGGGGQDTFFGTRDVYTTSIFGIVVSRSTDHIADLNSWEGDWRD